MRLLTAAKDYSSAISETGYILKEEEDNLEALLLRGKAYYYLADHDIAIRCFLNIYLVIVTLGLKSLIYLFPISCISSLDITKRDFV